MVHCCAPYLDGLWPFPSDYTVIGEFARSLRGFNGEAQRLAEVRREFFFSAFLCGPLRLCVKIGLALVGALPRCETCGLVFARTLWTAAAAGQKGRGSTRLSNKLLAWGGLRAKF